MPTSDGVAYLNTYDRSGVFVTVVSCIRVDEYYEWQTTHHGDGGSVAKLCAIILASQEYAEANFGPVATEYRRAEWR